jgi:hypothetical protein
MSGIYNDIESRAPILEGRCCEVGAFNRILKPLIDNFDLSSLKKYEL